jgi:hypothetical protein
MTRRTLLTIVPALLAGTAPFGAQQGPLVEIVKDPGCGCCELWAEHLRRAGFRTTVAESADMDAVKTRRGVPRAARSCHTGVVQGYVLEGHVPAADAQRLLRERPAGVIGIAVPGMPLGSPGMEVSTGRVQPYDVLAFDKAGKTTVFASHR